jgi:N-acetylneuraminic acid mutarotase
MLTGVASMQGLRQRCRTVAQTSLVSCSPKARTYRHGKEGNAMRKSFAAIAFVAYGICTTYAFATPKAILLLEITPSNIKQGWYAGADIPHPVNKAVAGHISGVVYVAGGMDESGPTDALQAYTPSTNSWANKAKLPKALYETSGADTHNGMLYVVGGWNGSLPTDTLFVYDPQTDTWTSKTGMPHLSACGTSNFMASELYVTTACDGFSGYRKDLDVYDPHTNTWRTLAHSYRAHADGAAASIDDKLYIAGGMTDAGITKVAEVYDLTSNKWTKLPDMPKAVMGAAGIQLRGFFVVIGGTDGHADQNLIQAYDPATNTWQKMGPTPPARSYAASANAYGRPFVIGGGSNGQTVGTNLNLALVTPIP